MCSTYKVNSETFNNYLERVKNNWFLLMSIVYIVILGMFGIIINGISDSILPLIFPAILLLLIFIFSIMFWTSQLQSFYKAEFKILNDSVEQNLNKSNRIILKYDDIKVIHNRKMGTLIIKGGSFLKLRYALSLFGSLSYLPWMPLIRDNQIFIPNNIDKYAELIDQIKINSKNALKIDLRISK